MLTVVSDAPPEDLPAFVAALPHTTAGDGVLDRIGQGLREALRRLLGLLR